MINAEDEPELYRYMAGILSRGTAFESLCENSSVVGRRVDLPAYAGSPDLGTASNDVISAKAGIHEFPRGLFEAVGGGMLSLRDRTRLTVR
jgi:hypothetical protein